MSESFYQHSSNLRLNFYYKLGVGDSAIRGGVSLSSSGGHFRAPAKKRIGNQRTLVLCELPIASLSGALHWSQLISSFPVY